MSYQDQHNTDYNAQFFKRALIYSNETTPFKGPKNFTNGKFKLPVVLEIQNRLQVIYRMLLVVLGLVT